MIARMHLIRLRRYGAGVMAALWLAACSGNSPLSPPVSVSNGSSAIGGAATRPLLYVSLFESNVVDVFDERGSAQKPIATLTNGVSFPGGMWVDDHRNLWLTNQTGSATGYILEFPPGASAPSRHIDVPSSYGFPTDVWVARDGVLYVTNVTTYDSGDVAAYAPKTQTWTLLQDSNLYFETGVVGDGKGNLYDAGMNGQGGEVDVLRLGKSATWKNTNIPLPYESGEIGIDVHGNLSVADPFTRTVQTFAPGKTRPINTISCPIDCTYIAFSANGKHLWSVDAPTSTDVQDLAYPRGKLLDTISVPTNSEPFGIASSPARYP